MKRLFILQSPNHVSPIYCKNKSCEADLSKKPKNFISCEEAERNGWVYKQDQKDIFKSYWLCPQCSI